MSSENQQVKKQWDTQTITVALAAGFGISMRTELLEQLHKKMEQLGVYKHEGPGNGLRYIELKALVAYLHKNGYRVTSLNEAVENMLAQDRKSEITDLQRILNTFVDTADMKVPEDGIMGSRSYYLLNSVLNIFRISSLDDAYNPELLRTISQRVVRAKSGSSLSPIYIVSNYFFVIDKGDNWQYELQETEEQAMLVNPVNNLEMIRINIRAANLRTSLNKFFPWFMLLNMKSANHYSKIFNPYNYRTKENEVPINKPWFIVEPDMTIAQPDAYDHIRLQLINHDPSIEYDLVCVFFFRDYSFKYQEPIIQPDGVIITDPEHAHYYNAANAIPDENVFPLHYASFLKIFAVKKDWIIDRHIYTTSDVEGPTPDVFYNLITIEKENLLATVTIGLDIPLHPSQQKVEEKKRLTPDEFKETVERLLREKPVTEPDDPQKGRWGGEKMKVTGSLSATVQEKKGGMYPVSLIFNGALEPAPATQVAFILHDSFDQMVHYVKVENGVAILNISAEEAFTVGLYADDGTELEFDLNTISLAPPGFPYYVPTKEFSEAVRSEYINRPIRVAEDIQKERWGGKARADGVDMNATVTAEGDNFRIIVTINATRTSAYASGKSAQIQSSRLLRPHPTEVALFLHNSFREEILYEQFVNGIARFELNATNAFTLGAYTNTGTSLELDLNELKGLPRDFHYEYVADTFIKQVKDFIDSPQMETADWTSRTNDKEIFAAFFKTSPLGPTLNISVSSTGRKLLRQDVAFIMPSDFPQPVIYEKMQDGEARITINSKQAFYIAAITSDGARLALDLNDIPGFPQEFYTNQEDELPGHPLYVRTGSTEFKNAPETISAPIDNYFRMLNGTELKNQSFQTYSATTREIQKFLADAINAKVTVRAVGSAWSYSDVALTDGWLLDTSDLTMVFSLVARQLHAAYTLPPDQLIFAQCGCTLQMINNALKERKQSLKSFTNSVGQTIAGAMSTGSHGSAPESGAIQDSVVGLHIITGPGQHVYLERSSYPVVSDALVDLLDAVKISDDELFNAALVSFGAFGIIHGVMLESRPIFTLAVNRMQMPVNADLIRLITSLDFVYDKPLLIKTDPYYFQVVIGPHFKNGNAWVTTMHRRPYKENKKVAKRDMGLAGPGDDVPAIFATQNITNPIDMNVDSELGTAADFFTNTAVRKGTISTAMCVPLDMMALAFETIINIRKPDSGLMGYVTFSYVKKSGGLLAFTPFNDNCIIQIDDEDSTATREYFSEIWRRMDNAGISYYFHWGKLNDITRERLSKTYGGNLRRWIIARNTLLSPGSRALFTSQKFIEWGLDDQSSS